MSVSARAGRRRQEGAEKVRGATRFTADLELAGLLHVRLVLSHAASARIGRIDTSAAKAALGVVDVVTGADLPELEVAGPELPLAVDRVFFAGQPVVAVVAESEAAAIDAASLVEGDAYSIGGANHSFLEPHVSVVRPEPDGSLTIWSPTQGPFVVRDEVSQLAGLPPHKVRVVPMPVGGGFGGKVLLLEPLLALLALRVRRPVRLALDRSHEFVFGRPAPAARFEVELGAKRDGTLVALRATYTYDNGAAAGWHAGLTGNFLGGTYRIPNFELRGFEVATNKTPVDAYRAPGATQAFFALEVALDELAARLDLDPVELRLRNVSREGDPGADGRPWPRIASVEVLEEARRHPVYSAPVGAGEAVGVALGAWGGARTPSAAGCRVDPDGTIA